MSVARIEFPETFDSAQQGSTSGGIPRVGGLLDLRLGTNDRGLRCGTCGGSMYECAGHFGHMELCRPIVHVGKNACRYTPF